MLSAKTAAVSLAIIIAITMIANMVISGIDIIDVLYLVVLLFGYMKFRSLSDTE